jgi:hypothetical protein
MGPDTSPALFLFCCVTNRNTRLAVQGDDAERYLNEPSLTAAFWARAPSSAIPSGVGFRVGKRTVDDGAGFGRVTHGREGR